MQVAVITIGDEVLSGDTANSNGTWLASRLTERGVDVERILTVPDDRVTIADRVNTYSDAFDAVIVTGGIGSTPDDVTMEAVADAFDREMIATDAIRRHVEETIEQYEQTRPELDIDVDIDAEAALPANGRPLLNPEGLAPGCVLENVYVLPGLPGELKAMFSTVSEEFVGDTVSTYLYTVEPESNISNTLQMLNDRFSVSVGCYPDREQRHNRLQITATDEHELGLATAWLLDRINASRDVVSRDWE